MQIEPVNNNLYDRRGQYDNRPRQRFLKKKRKILGPIDAVAFEFSSYDEKSVRSNQEQSMLKAYVDALPDEEVNRRMKEHKSSFDFIEDALIEKLLMEEL